MCGIAGIITAGRPINKSILDEMVKRLHHRGPDDNGVWVNKNENVGLVHTRLAIMDTSSAGKQPMHDDSGMFHLSANAEIYNYPELKKEILNSNNYSFKSRSDCEVLLPGYKKFGENFFEKLNGMFAISIIDERQGVAYLVRDRIGIKPLYYTRADDQFIFASEIKAIFAALQVKSWKIDETALHQYLGFQSPLGNRTLFKKLS